MEEKDSETLVQFKIEKAERNCILEKEMPAS